MASDVVLRAVRFDKVKIFAKSAARARVSISDTGQTQWFEVLIAEAGDAFSEVSLVRVGVAGLMALGSVVSGKRARIKGVFVEPAARGRGVGTKIVDELEAFASREWGVRTIEAFAHNPKFYEARGYRRCGVLANGAVHLRRG